MLAIPSAERERFISIVNAVASRYKMSFEDYIRKVWYHQEAAILGEYVALTLANQLMDIVPIVQEDAIEQSDGLA